MDHDGTNNTTSTTPAAPIDLRDPSLYLNRELSVLDFNRRVLALAQDERIPLLERLRFLTISCSNLDEFFEIRVSGLKQLVEHQLTRSEPDGMSAQRTLREVGKRAHELMAEQYRVLNDVLLPGLSRHHIELIRRDQWNDTQRAWVKRYFVSEVLPVLTPVGLDPAHPFPRIQNKSLNFAITVEGYDAFGRESGTAIVQVPRSLPRVIRLPSDVCPPGTRGLVLLSSILHAHVDELFPGMEITGCWQFRVTRDSDLWVDEEDVDDLMRALKGELTQRRFGTAVRLEVAESCPQRIAQFLLDNFGLGDDDLYRCPGPVNLNRLSLIHELVDQPQLKYPPFTPRLPARLERAATMFDAILQGDLVLHHPYDSFAPVIDLVRGAAADPNVLAIKQTLYRVGARSPIVDALIEACRAGKDVTVLVELRARFDEEANIDLATRLQDAGAKVAYGIVGYKTHAKMLLIVRREGRKLRRYVHLSTGNYHSRTAQAYTDIGLLTANHAIAEDVHGLFNQLTGLGKVRRLKRVIQSPFDLATRLVQWIDFEAEEARAGRPARIIAKMNALTEPHVIQALYRASQAGVRIDLIVRGICGLKPGIRGVSEHIHVRSVMGRFLEHARVFYFHAAGEERVYCSSADWMQRNLSRRVETCFPIEDSKAKARVFEETLRLGLADNTFAWTLGPDGTWQRSDPGRTKPLSVQTKLLRQITSLRDLELESFPRENGGFGVEVGSRQRVLPQPVAGEGQAKASARHGDAKRRKRARGPAPVQQNGETKHDREPPRQPGS